MLIYGHINFIYNILQHNIGQPTYQSYMGVQYSFSIWTFLHKESQHHLHKEVKVGISRSKAAFERASRRGKSTNFNLLRTWSNLSVGEWILGNVPSLPNIKTELPN